MGLNLFLGVVDIMSIPFSHSLFFFWICRYNFFLGLLLLFLRQSKEELIMPSGPLPVSSKLSVFLFSDSGAGDF